LREALRWKARKGGSRWGRGGKKATLDALFAALPPHGLCPRTWNRAPTPSVARGHALIKIKKHSKIIFPFNYFENYKIVVFLRKKDVTLPK
jgi:hypothetical protein